MSALTTVLTLPAENGIESGWINMFVHKTSI